MRLGGGAEAPARARRAVGRLRGDVDAPTARDAASARDGDRGQQRQTRRRSDAVNLKVSVGPGAVLTEVTDDGDGFEPDRRCGAPRADHTGWGLFLVERLASAGAW